MRQGDLCHRPENPVGEPPGGSRTLQLIRNDLFKFVLRGNHIGTLRTIGEVSGIIHEYLIDCWNWARKKEPVLEEAELIIEQIDAVSFCQDCGQDGQHKKPHLFHAF